MSVAAALRPHTAALGPHVAPFIEHYIAHWKPYRPFWNYEDGCVYKGALDLADATNVAALSAFVWREVSARVSPEGRHTGFNPDEFNIDNINAGKVLFRLHARTGEPRFALAIEQQYQQLLKHPRTASGNFWHKKIYPHQVWLDGLYMAQPFLCAYARFRNRDDIVDDVLRQFAHVRATMRDQTSGLYYHGWDESRRERWSDPVTGCSPCFWGRAVGWFAMALVDCIELIPEQRADRTMLIEMLGDLAEALMKVRSPDGLWWQVLDQGGRAGNYEEASASVMIAYAFMKGARLQILERKFGQAGRESLRTCTDRFLSPTELNGICAVAGLGNQPYRDGSYEYYISEPVVSNDPKGVGAYLMALAEACLG